ncbi:hypothetical protein NG799_27525 [Laspinema sp. D1]|uniref:Uncharacterized protein n=1 Tax=Laspinema palackyanum D2a TaxID=2953684 RepID=A0ABT2MZH5_9CYAN|nr:hypothetical protein [Laspinema sp. D2b]MCT7970068.1 hypothetical protein [Laspinema sp. D2a]
MTQNQPNRSQHPYLILTIPLQGGSKAAIFPKHRTPDSVKKATPGVMTLYNPDSTPPQL